MRISYWSNSKFAELVRKVIGLPPQPKVASAEGWDEFYKLENSVSTLGVKFINSFNTMQKIVYWPYDTITHFGYYLSNISNGTHVLRTSIKRGQWGDLTSKIPDALMYAIIDYVEKECFWMNVAFVTERPDDVSEAVWDYKNQSYLKRRLFPAKITDEERAFHGLQYIEFQMENCGEEAKANYIELIAAYHFAKNTYFKFDAFEESGYYKLTKEEGFMCITDEQRDCFKIVDALEKDFAAEVSKHCINLIKHREYLWT